MTAKAKLARQLHERSGAIFSHRLPHNYACVCALLNDETWGYTQEFYRPRVRTHLFGPYLLVNILQLNHVPVASVESLLVREELSRI